MNEGPEVAVVMGSDSDWQLVKQAVRTLDSFGVRCEAKVISAHRTPDVAASYARQCSERGVKVIIAAAGGAAHLAGAMAAHSILPVVGIPIAGGTLGGLDSLLSTAQMPAGVPVATVTLGSAGAVNAAILAVQILAVSRPDLQEKLRQYKVSMRDKVLAGDERVRADMRGEQTDQTD